MRRRSYCENSCDLIKFNKFCHLFRLDGLRNTFLIWIYRRNYLEKQTRYYYCLNFLLEDFSGLITASLSRCMSVNLERPAGTLRPLADRPASSPL